MDAVGVRDGPLCPLSLLIGSAHAHEMALSRKIHSSSSACDNSSIAVSIRALQSASKLSAFTSRVLTEAFGGLGRVLNSGVASSTIVSCFSCNLPPTTHRVSDA